MALGNFFGTVTWAAGPGWYGVGPLALKEGDDQKAEGAWRGSVALVPFRQLVAPKPDEGTLAF